MLIVGTAFAIAAMIALAFEMTGTAATAGAVAYFLIAHTA